MTKVKNFSKQLFANVNAQAERKLVDKLREIGLDQYVELPQIAVMGDTSSGKSSLLSALSGVSFPSNDQLTTRCPTQLILSSADTFRGDVRLVRFRPDGDEGDKEEDRESLNCLDDVPDAITKLTQKLVDEGQYISDDQIVIEMSGPELPNLTLTDLPGLVRTVGDHEDQRIIPRVRQMVNRYMKQERTVIIAVVPANVDMHNTEILQAAQEADPDGIRTIAVVTKVDLVDAGAEQAVHDLLLNKKKFMHLGYHAVRCRSQLEVNDGITIENGLAYESKFFRGHRYWRELRDELWGVPGLTTRLVTILQNNIRRALPKVIAEINTRMAKAHKELGSLGIPLEDLSSQRQQLGKWVNQYLRQMEATMNGQYDQLPSTTDHKGEDGHQQADADIRLRAVLRTKENAFQIAIKEMKNHITGIKRTKPKKEVEVGDDVQVDIDGEWCSAKVIEVNGTVVRCAEFTGWLAADTWRFDKFAATKHFIRENRGDELSIFPSYQVFCNLYRQCVDEWGGPTQQLLDGYRIQTKLVSDLVTTGLHATSRVAQFIKNTSVEVLDCVVQAAKEEMDTLLAAESRPYTQDQRLFSEMDKKRLRGLQDQMKDAVPVDSCGRARLADVMKAIASIAPTTDDREALEMQMALQAYLDVAMPRFVDLIPMRLNDLVLCQFAAGMARELNSVTDDKLARLMGDSEQKVATRKRLKSELVCFGSAKKEIEMVC